MIRRLFTVSSAISLLLSLIVAGWWAWTWRVADTFTRQEGHYPLVPNGVTDPNDPDFHEMDVTILHVRLRTDCGQFALTFERSIPDLKLGPDDLKFWQPDDPEGVHYRWRQDPADPEWVNPAEDSGNAARRRLFDRGAFHVGTYRVTSISTPFSNFLGSYVTGPIGAMLIVTLVLPCWKLSRKLILAGRQRRAAARGSCLNCGYDLRASNDLCPECGTPISPNAGATA